MNCKRGKQRVPVSSPAARGIKLGSISHAAEIGYNGLKSQTSPDIVPPRDCSYVHNDKSYTRVDYDLPVLSIQKFPFIQTSAELRLPLLVELIEAGELFGVYCIDAGSAVSDSFGPEVRQFAKSLFVSKLMFGTRLMNSPQRQRIIKFLSSVHRMPQVSRNSFFYYPRFL